MYSKAMNNITYRQETEQERKRRQDDEELITVILPTINQ